MSRIQGTLKLSSNIEPQVGAPLDARTIVETKSELTREGNYNYSYIGMMVSVRDEANVYILKAKPTTVASNWAAVASSDEVGDMYYTKSEIDTGWYNREQVDQLIAKLYKPAGTATIDTLPLLTANVVGNVYNMAESFETTSDFVEGAGKTYGVGTNVVVVDLGDYTTVTPEGNEDPSDEGWYEIKNGVYVLSQDTEVKSGKTYYSYNSIPKFDILPGFVDLSGYQTKMQVTELPTASEDELGNIYQYIGATENGLVKGFFYICQEVADSDPTEYEWVLKPVQDMAGGGELSAQLKVSKSTGGIEVGTTYNSGTIFEQLWRDLLNPLENPELVAPSASLTTDATRLMEVGSSASISLTAVLDRGSITPANGTSGYRSGVAESYTLNEGTPQSTDTFDNVTVDSDHDSFTVAIAYDGGEQPKDSRGGNYSTALAAGTVTSPALTFEFVNALYANTADITTVAKLALISANAKSKEFTFPAATATNPEVFDVPASWTVAAVEVYNTLSGTWESCASEFDITNVTHNDASGTETAYKRYTCNLGYAMASRRIRLKWS